MHPLNHLIARATHEEVVRGTGTVLEHIIAGIAVQTVAAAAAVEGVVARAAVQFAQIVPVSQHIVMVRPKKGHRLDVGIAPNGAVSEANLFQLVVACAVAGEVVAHRHLVGRARQRQDQIVARTGDQDIARRDVRRELDSIHLAGAAVVVVVDRVLAPATAETVHVAVGIAAQGVVAGAAFEDVVAGAAVQAVVALAPPL